MPDIGRSHNDTLSPLQHPDAAHDLNARAKEAMEAARKLHHVADQGEWCLWAREQDGLNQEYVERQFAKVTEEIAGAIDGLIYVIEDRELLSRLYEARGHV